MVGEIASEHRSAANSLEVCTIFSASYSSYTEQILKSTAPIGVSIISFLTFVAQGNKLTVGTAFTAIALFNMIRQPLNTVPTWLVQVLQTRVALKRIEKFLDEDEVDGQVSSLKEDVDVGPLRKDLGPETFGLKNASFKWNAILKEDSENKAKDGKSGKGKKSGSGAEADLEAALREALPSTESEETVFELRDINVTFPEGLTVVTGPTASGKTALLVSSAWLIFSDCSMTDLGSQKAIFARRNDQNFGRNFNVKGSIAYCFTREWSYTIYLLCCADTMVTTSVHQGEYPFWLTI